MCYQQAKKRGLCKEPLKSVLGGPCKIEGCERPVAAKGLCSRCYMQARRDGTHGVKRVKVCAKRGCAKPSYARGLCYSHYGSARRRGDFDEKAELPPPGQCYVAGCERPAVSLGLCRGCANE